jgi:hypothetical protein
MSLWLMKLLSFQCKCIVPNECKVPLEVHISYYTFCHVYVRIYARFIPWNPAKSRLYVESSAAKGIQDVALNLRKTLILPWMAATLASIFLPWSLQQQYAPLCHIYRLNLGTPTRPPPPWWSSLSEDTRWWSIRSCVRTQICHILIYSPSYI